MDEALDLILADDQIVFLDAMTTVLTQLGHTVRAVATTPAGLVDRVKAFRPDVCLMEGTFGGASGVAQIETLLRASPATKIVVLTADEDSRTMRQALDAGASGYVHKTRGVPVLIDALRRVSAGEVVVEGSFRREPRAAARSGPSLTTALTHRELECLQMLTAGLDTAAMARRLGVSRTTVRSHVQAVLTKLGAHSRLEAASLALRHRLVPAEPDALAEAR